MRIGVGLPSNVAGVSGPAITQWATRAEQLGFSSLVVTDRFAWNQLEPLAVLAAASAVTESIMLRTSVLLVPNRVSAPQLAKQLATLDRLAGGRLVVGVGVGDREIDYRLAGASHMGRHARLDEMLEEMQALWSGVTAEDRLVGPRPSSPIRLMVGGSGAATWRRAAKYGIGWTMAVGGLAEFRSGAAGMREAWAGAGRAGSPLVAVQRYFSALPANERAAQDWLRSYFSFFPAPAVDNLILSAPTNVRAVEDVATAFSGAGADELAFLPTTADLSELEALAALVL
jgi:alkanesulfonate monooxygenase SsuD/methylene tetrahydromethanopterin reductase-like flavin-dependent oxidoreductase (luciferase family)